jgi:hypothetical protein
VAQLSPLDKMSDDLLQSYIDRFSKQFGGPRLISRPTDRSIERIQRELGFSIPRDFVEFARRCDVYASWFTSIGEDFADPIHILNINRQYRSAEYGSLPEDLVVINHGYDGDLNCYDLSKVDAEGRISICYCWVSESGNPVFEDERQHLGYTIFDYLIPSLDFWEKDQDRK